MLSRPGDIVVLLPTSVEAVWKQALAFSGTAARQSAQADNAPVAAHAR